MNTQTQEALKIIEKAEWLADKIVAFGDYGQEAALRLRQLAQMQREALAQPAQEPVAFVDINWVINYTEHGVNSCYEPTFNPTGKLKIGDKLYTHLAPSCSCKDKK